MSWWDTKGFTNLATQALKTAQKKIDKVLDIGEEEGQSTEKSSQPTKAASKDAASKDANDSWNTWLGYKPADSDTADQSETQSSWSFPWGSQDTSLATKSAEPALSEVANCPSSFPQNPRSSSSSSAAAKGSSLRAKRGSFPSLSETSPAGSESDKKPTFVKKDSNSSDQGIAAVPGGEDKPAEISAVDVPKVERRESVKTVEYFSVERTPQESIVSKDKGEEQCHEKDSLSGAETSVVVEGDTVSHSGECEERVGQHVKHEGSEVVTASATSDASLLSAKADSLVETCTSERSEAVDEACVAPEDTEQSADDQKGCEDHISESPAPQSLDTAGSFSGEVGSKKSQPAAPVQAEELVSGGRPFDEAFETITRDSSKDTLDSIDAVASTQGFSAEASDESMSAFFSSSENIQFASASITSTMSEPVLLTVSSEDNMVNLASFQAEQLLPEVDVFSPPSHSSVVSEEENDFKTPPFDRSWAADEKTSAVVSPRLDSAGTLSSNDSSDTSRLDSSMDTVVDQTQSQQSLQDVEEGHYKEGDEHFTEMLSDADANSPSASFVKCMIEEAMEDASKLEDSGSDNHSEEKSESSKVDSEFEKSVCSGHESSDEITSSDIEIISTPTPNGEKNIVDLSPLHFSLQKATGARSRSQGHQRTDSQSSSSTHSKGEPEQVFPERDSDQERQDWHREDDDFDNPQHPQHLLKKLAEMAEILQARETRLVQLSKDNNELLETNSILRSQLQQAEEEKNAEMTDLNALSEEFSRRMGESERKLQAALKEKEAMKQQLQLAQSELAKRSEDTSLQAVLAEKDEQITGLIEEGEKLSKQQLQNSNIIKKLRAKEKENEGLIASQKKKIEQQTEELDRLKKVLDGKEDLEKKQADAIKQLSAAVQMLEKEKAKIKIEVDAAEEKIRGLQATLDNSYKEIAELHKSNAAQDSRAHQAALSAEMQVREELKMAMEQESQRYQQEREALISQIEDLRLSMARMEKDHNRREEMLKQEISDLQMRLQEDESRNQDLTQSVTSATRPLLRQIENLQATHSIQTSAWEKVERNLTDRLSEARTALAIAQEKERAAIEKLAEVSSRCTALEASNSQLRQEKAQLLAQKESDRRRIDFLEDRKASDLAQLELTKQKLSDDVASLRKDKVFLESQLETERSRLEAERQRVAVAEEQIRILERERPRSRGTPSPVLVSVSRQESMSNSFSERSSTPTFFQQRSFHEDVDSHFMTPPGPKTSLYDSMRQSGATALVENLQSQLKLREGEIAQLQVEIQQLEQTRESMARELVNLTNQNEELQDKVKELPKLQENFKALDSRYNALLQMYGEKEEQVQELMLDLQDVKDMYKSQINVLMPK